MGTNLQQGRVAVIDSNIQKDDPRNLGNIITDAITMSAAEVLKVDTISEVTASGGVTIDGAVIKDSGISTGDTMTPGAGIVAGITTAVNYSIVRTGNVIETTIYIDLIGLSSATSNKDIIGATGVSHIGQITTAINGVIFAGEVHCAVVPTTGDDDIDLYHASVGTGAYDADASALTNAAVLMTSGGAYAIGTVKPLTALPTANYYLYLATGDTTAGAYGAGKVIIKLWGLAS